MEGRLQFVRIVRPSCALPSSNLLTEISMGDVKLTPRQAAAILTKLDDGARSVADAREQVIQAMADRRAERPEKAKRELAGRKRRDR